jgi:hypothetical protein
MGQREGLNKTLSDVNYARSFAPRRCSADLGHIVADGGAYKWQPLE